MVYLFAIILLAGFYVLIFLQLIG